MGHPEEIQLIRINAALAAARKEYNALRDQIIELRDIQTRLLNTLESIRKHGNEPAKIGA